MRNEEQRTENEQPRHWSRFLILGSRFLIPHFFSAEVRRSYFFSAASSSSIHFRDSQPFSSGAGLSGRRFFLAPLPLSGGGVLVPGLVFLSSLRSARPQRVLTMK